MTFLFIHFLLTPVILELENSYLNIKVFNFLLYSSNVHYYVIARIIIYICTPQRMVNFITSHGGDRKHYPDLSCCHCQS